jgi:hypothetical protein
MLMFALELQRRSDAGGWGITSVAAHPGIAATALVTNGPGDDSLMGRLAPVFGRFFAHSSAAGALPTLLAATAPNATRGGYYGPTGFREFRGPPGVAKIESQALDVTVAKALWAAAERLIGQAFTPAP